jgi:hypothetical protein|tara:strand:+ start:1991 stop:2689 length:699 start_codon:yes stop_codon:yes gene_type:complete
MARIQKYPLDTNVTGGDKLIGTDISSDDATKSFQIETLAQYFEQTGNSLFQYNFAGTYSNETIATGEYRYQVDPSAPTIYGWANITGIAISRYNRNGEDITPMIPLLVNQVIKITDIGTSESLGYGLYKVSSSTSLSSGGAYLLTLQQKGSASTVGNNIISIAPFGTEGFEYVFTQSAASATWTITHNLGRYPSVTTVDSAGSIINGAITYTSDNVITVVFTSATSGKAYLN